MKFSPFFCFSPFLIALLTATSATAATYVDPFTDGTLNGGADNSGLSWYRRSSNQSITVADDTAGIGSGNALKLTVTNGTQIDRAVVGSFSSFSLTNVGDQISLQFDFRFELAPTLSKTDGFRFGFYNSNGSPIVSNGLTESDNDLGYQASIGTGGSTGFDIFKESNNDTGGLGSSSPVADRQTLNPTVSNTATIADTLKHTALFTITQTSTGVSISSSVDGTLLGTATSTIVAGSPFLTFDEVVFNHGTPQNYLVDNVRVTTTAVPEPSTMALAGLGLAGLLFRRRR